MIDDSSSKHLLLFHYNSLVLDLANKIDKSSQGITCLSEVFAPRLTELRSLLQDKCYALILQEKSYQAAHKIETLLWNKVYHSTVQVFKKHKETATDQEIALLVTHLLSGIGFYSNMIDVLKKQLVLDVSSEGMTSDKKEVMNKITHVIHRSMIFEGDLYRYLEDTGSLRCISQAMFWYQRALLWDPTVGLPHNQLATISWTANYGLHAVYHALRW